jgi:glutamyl-tRNA synthetase
LIRFQESTGLSKTKAWQPVRAAITGSDVSPPIDASVYLLGRERAVARLRAAAAALVG